MGLCGSKADSAAYQQTEGPEAISSEQVELNPEPLVVRLISAHNLPALDLLSESDVFVLGSLVDNAGTELAKAQWPVKWDSADPVWDSCRQFGDVLPPAGARLVLQLYDHDESEVRAHNFL